MKPTDADHPPPIIVAAVWRADRPSLIILPDRRADSGKETTPDQGTTKYYNVVQIG